MDNHTFTAGVSPDGIKNGTDIKILICYILSKADEPMDRGDVLGIIYEHRLANYLEAGDAMAKLIQNDHISDDENGVLSLTALGKRVAEDLYRRLPNTVRAKSDRATVKLCSRRRNERENTVAIDECANGYRVCCTIPCGSEGDTLMSVSLYCPTLSRANQMRERFFDDPAALYRAVLSCLSGKLPES